MSARITFFSLLTCLRLLIASYAWCAAPQASDKQRTDCYGDALPPGALARMGSVRFFHDQAPTLLAFSPDGKILAVAGNGANSFRQFHACTRLLDATTGRQLCQLAGHSDTRSLRFSPDGKLLISSGHDWDGKDDQTIKIWDMVTGKELHRLKGVALTHDAKTLIAVAPQMDKSIIRLSDVATGKMLREIAVSRDLSWKVVVVAPDCKTIAGGVKDAVYIWDATTGKELHHLSGGDKGVYWLAYSPDGKRLAACFGDEAVKVWDAISGKELHRWDGYPGTAGNLAAFSPDGKTLAVPWQNKMIRLWDVVSGRESSRIKLTRDFGELSLTFSPDGKTLAWGGESGGSEQGLIHLWDLAEGKERLPAGRLLEPINSVAFSPDGKTLLTVGAGYRDEPLRFWETTTGKQLRQFKEVYLDPTATLSPTGRLLATEGEKLQLWDLTAGKEIPLPKKAPRYSTTAMAFSPDERFLAVGGKGTIRFLDTAKGEERRSFGKLGRIFSIAFSADGKELLALNVGGDGLSIKVWNVEDGKLTQTIRDRNLAISKSMAVSSDGRILAAISHTVDRRIGTVVDTWVVLWDLTTGKPLRELRPTRKSEAGFTSGISSLAFSPDDRTLACAYGREGAIRLWESATGQERRKFEGHRQTIRCLAFSSDGTLLATGADDNTALVWDVTGRLDNGPVGQSDLSDGVLHSLWGDLAAKDAAVAYRAMCRLLAGRQIVPFLRRQVEPLAPLDAPQREQMKRWIADLDHAEFDRREKAAAELEKMGEAAEPVLRAALADKPSLEVRRCLEHLLEKVNPALSPQRMRALRAVEVLEHIATPEARELLQALADGEPAYRLTRDAKASLHRLASRSKRQP